MSPTSISLKMLAALAASLLLAMQNVYTGMTSVRSTINENDYLTLYIHELTISTGNASSWNNHLKVLSSGVPASSSATNNTIFSSSGPPQDDPDRHLSACILIMDENPRLPEWIAYHYFALRLRYLVIGVDPRSVELPSSILEKWRNLVDDLTILEWNEKQHFYSTVPRGNWTPFQYLEKRHQRRQQMFIRECTIHMKKQNKTFVTYHDADEYLAINEQKVPNAQLLASRPDNVWNILTTMDRKNAVRGNYFVSNHTNADACYLFARRMFPPKDSIPRKLHRFVPTGFNASKFETLRWRHHSNALFQVPGKTILDVSRIPLRAIRMTSTNPHATLQNVCQNSFSFYTKVLGYHHYSGSRELFFRKNDSRAERVDDLWRKRSDISARVETDEIRPWLRGFVNMVGREKAEILLEDAGDLSFKYLIHKT